MFHPVLFFILLVTDLIHDIERIAAVRVDGLVQAHGILYGVQGVGDILRGNADLCGDFFHAGFLEIFAGERFLGIDRLVCRIL